VTLPLLVFTVRDFVGLGSETLPSLVFTVRDFVGLGSVTLPFLVFTVRDFVGLGSETLPSLVFTVRDPVGLGSDTLPPLVFTVLAFLIKPATLPDVAFLITPPVRFFAICLVAFSETLRAPAAISFFTLCFYYCTYYYVT